MELIGINIAQDGIDLCFPVPKASAIDRVVPEKQNSQRMSQARDDCVNCAFRVIHHNQWQAIMGGIDICCLPAA